MISLCKAEEWGVAVATSIDDNAADGIIDKYKVGVFKNDYTSTRVRTSSVFIVEGILWLYIFILPVAKKGDEAYAGIQG